MVRLGQAARFSARGDRNAHVGMDDPLENRGFALWLACQGKIKTSKAEKKQGPADRGVGNVDGYEIEVNLKRKVFELWPGLNQMDKSSQESFIGEIYAYLRASGNAICVKQPGLGGGSHGIPTWWLREKWNDVKAVGIFRPTELTSRERRLTPAEAGEDRPPAPVESRKLEGDALKQRRLELLEKARAKNKTRWDADRQVRTKVILDILTAAPWPLYSSEVIEQSGLTFAICDRLLRDLVAEGVVFRRLETREERGKQQFGRFHQLYWHSDPVPLRPVEQYRQTTSTLDKLQAGQALKLKRLSAGVKKDVLELIEAGMVEKFVGDDGEVRVRLVQEVKPKPAAKAPEPSVEPAKPDAPAERPTVPTYDTVTAIGAAISRMIDEKVQSELAERDVELDGLRAKAERVTALEASLIKARTELSDARSERDELREKLNGIRKSLGL